MSRPRKFGKRDKSGRLKRDQRRDFTLEKEVEMQANTLTARCNAMGLTATYANLVAMRTQISGCEAGRAIMRHTVSTEERTSLFAAVQHMRIVTARYDQAIGAPNRHAASLRILLPVDELHADASSPAMDDRTPEARDRAAVSAYMRLEGWLMHTDGRAVSEAKRVCLDDQRVKDQEGLMLALACVADGLAGRKISFRGR
jgi:hypothetical protein